MPRLLRRSSVGETTLSWRSGRRIAVVGCARCVRHVSPASLPCARLMLHLVCLTACGPSDMASAPARCNKGNCEIVLDHVATLSDTIEPGLIATNRSLWVQSDSRGRFFLPASSADRVLVFDSSGALTRQVGRRGSGPGEFRRTTYLLVGPGDSLYVPDGGLRRLTIMSPDLEVVSVSPAPHPVDLVTANGTFIVARDIPTRRVAGQPVHVVDRTGRVQSSFGSDASYDRPGAQRLSNRLVALSDHPALWLAAPGRYRFELWDSDSGQRLRRLTVVSTWFHESAEASAPNGRPHPTVVGMWEGEEGTLWVLSRIADRDWRPHPSDPMAERAFDPIDYSQRHDWMLEVIDTSTADVLASRRLDNYPGNRASAAFLVTLRDASIGGTSLDVWRPSLIEGGRAYERR